MSSYGVRIDAEKARATVDRIVRISPPGGRLEAAGSLRRGKPTVGDVDIVLDGTDPAWVSRVLTAIAGLAGEQNCHRTKKDGTLKSVMLDGVPAELYISRPNAWGAMWLFTVGSGAWNIYQRAVANRKGLMLSQFGLFEPTVDHKGKRVAEKLVAAREERDIFEALGMPYVEPEDREPGRVRR